MRLLLVVSLLSGLLWSLIPRIAEGAVSGRYVRFEAPASGRLALHEIEVFSGGKNVVLNNDRIKFFSYVRQDGRDINFRNEQRRLVDGKIDFNSRGLELRVESRLNPWVEVDLGTEIPIERIRIVQPKNPLFADRALRLLSVLDSDRRVVFLTNWDIRRKPYHEGIADFAVEPVDKVRWTVAKGANDWAPLGQMLDARELPAPPDAAERQRRFAERNSPEAIEKLARAFYARLDSSKPELAEVRKRFEQKDYPGMLDAYRDHFLKKLQSITFLHFHESDPDATSYASAGSDMLNNRAVVFSRFDVEAMSFTPGTINWAHVAADGGEGAVDTARARAEVGRFQRPLLSAYRRTGRPEYLQQWAAITDDWGMNILGDLERSEHDLRDYFVKEQMQWFSFFTDELAQTAREQPEFGRHLSGATLARMLIPVLEEYPPGYWWVVRRTIFNHTYNAMIAASLAAPILDDFHAGQRLAEENRQHWQRVWTMCMTRDGSMAEIGDEGHLFMQWRMGVLFRLMQEQERPPAWFTSDFQAEFLTGWRQTATYPIRHIAPNGMGHRFGYKDLFSSIWELCGDTCTVGGMIPRKTIDSRYILRDPEVAAILQSVYGAGRDREKLSPARQAAWDQVVAFYGREFTPPTLTSDFMPYAGLWYLRRSWDPDATFVSMICQPVGHPSSNGSDWNTIVQMWDHGQPLYRVEPVTIDRQTQFDAADRRTFAPGSKTEELATASERPIPSRWHSSPRFDFAESFYEGTYQTHNANLNKGELKLGDTPVRNARADRRVVMVKPARLVIITDVVTAPQAKKARRYEMKQVFGSPEMGTRSTQHTGNVDGGPEQIKLTHESAPGLTLRCFSPTTLTWSKGDQPNWGGRGAVLGTTSDSGLLLTSLLESHASQGEATIAQTRDRSAPGLTGFEATLRDGSQLVWLATSNSPRALTAGAMSIDGEGLLLWERDGKGFGLALGVKALRIDGRAVNVPSTDFEFALENGKLASVTTIYRPIEPVTFSPAETVFVDRVSVEMKSATPGVEIRYTLDGSEPDASSPLYTGPVVIDRSAYIRARAFRPGVKKVPFSTAGTLATVVSDARFQKQAPRAARRDAAQQLEPGLQWELVDGVSYLALFSHLNLPEVMPAVARGTTRQLLDVSMRRQDGPFGVRYSGYLDVPADGVWTFHAPREYVGASCEPGYDLRIWIDGTEWDLGGRFHGRGTSSITLEKGLHHVLVTFADARHRNGTIPRPGMWRSYPTPWVIWQGEASPIEISGPGVARQPIPVDWFRRPAR
jgi:hypothetical protein